MCKLIIKEAIQGNFKHLFHELAMKSEGYFQKHDSLPLPDNLSSS